MNLAHDDFENRGPVWDALAELFLDTELTEAVAERIGRVLSASPYTLEELESILYDAVYPACMGNLRSVAGEWAGFDRASLQERILRQKRSWFRAPRFLQTGRGMVREPWAKVRSVVIGRRANGICGSL